MTACRPRSSGSPSSRSASARRSQGPARVGGSASDEVDRLADGLDLRRFLVAHAHAVGVLELLHEAVEIERVRLQVLLEVGLLLDAGRVELQLVGQMRPDVRDDLLAGHGSGTLAVAADGAGGRRSAPAAASRACVRPHDVRAHAARGERDRARDPPRAERPVRHHRRVRAGRAGTRRPAPRGRSRSRSPRSAGAQQQPPGLGAAGSSGGVAHRARAAPPPCPPSPSSHVAGEAVGDHHVGGAGADRRALHVADEVAAPRARRAQRAAATRSAAASLGSVPLDSSATRGRADPHHRLLKAAPM